jgi:hypothetical protein
MKGLQWCYRDSIESLARVSVTIIINHPINSLMMVVNMTVSVPMTEQYHDPDWDEDSRACSLCGSDDIRVKVDERGEGRRRLGYGSRYSETKIQLHCMGCNRIWEETTESNIGITGN